MSGYLVLLLACGTVEGPDPDGGSVHQDGGSVHQDAGSVHEDAGSGPDAAPDADAGAPVEDCTFQTLFEECCTDGGCGVCVGNVGYEEPECCLGCPDNDAGHWVCVAC